MWIRSQSKCVLVKLEYVNKIRIGKDKNRREDIEAKGEYSYFIAYNNECYKLGDYSSKEKCLEVLEEIQNWVINKAEEVFIMPAE